MKDILATESCFTLWPRLTVVLYLPEKISQIHYIAILILTSHNCVNKLVYGLGIFGAHLYTVGPIFVNLCFCCDSPLNFYAPHRF